jgi:hypothetical protein
MVNRKGILSKRLKIVRAKSSFTVVLLRLMTFWLCSANNLLAGNGRYESTLDGLIIRCGKNSKMQIISGDQVLTFRGSEE